MPLIDRIGALTGGRVGSGVSVGSGIIVGSGVAAGSGVTRTSLVRISCAVDQTVSPEESTPIAAV